MLSEQQHPLSWHFNSRPSARGDSGGGRADWRKHYFNSRPSARGDASPPDRWRSASYFNSRPSARGDAMMPFSYMNFAISIHAPPRGATLHEKRGKLSGLISIHAPPRGATMTRIGAGLWGQFQFTPLREGRRGASGKTAAGCYFNSRPSARGDCARANCKIANRAFQFTPLREGRHVRLWERTICTGISIHAPPRGATDAKTGIVKSKDISIHAPPRGATTQVDTIDGYVLFQFTPLREGRLVPFPRIKSFILFQFTPLREGRPRLSSVLVASRYISIHAPPRGATGIRMAQQAMQKFQFTPLREGRLCPCGASYFFIVDFNSRPSARGD